ncbi:hypothetical protein ACLB2K_014200 [Fragaria x ananassa]
MEEGGDLQEHLNKFQICVANLSEVDVQYEEEDKALMLLTSLPASYEQFITTLVSGKDSLKYDDITEAIQSYIKTSSETKSSQGGLQVKGKETSQLTSKEDKSGNKGTTKSKKKYKEGCFKYGACCRSLEKKLQRREDGSTGDGREFKHSQHSHQKR